MTSLASLGYLSVNANGLGARTVGRIWSEMDSEKWSSATALWRFGQELASGTLIECVHAWASLSPIDRAEAYIQTAEPIFGKRSFRTEQINWFLGMCP